MKSSQKFPGQISNQLRPGEILENFRREMPGLAKGEAYPKKNQVKKWWKPEEDSKLQELVNKYGVAAADQARNWKKIAGFFRDRTDVQCLHRWQKVLNPSLVKGPWTQDEDELVRQMVGLHGPKNWSLIAQKLPGRIGKQCRERWHNHLNPNIKKERWSEEEDVAIMEAHRL